MNKITRIGLDIAKNVFVLHAVNEHGKTVKRQTLSRAKVLPFFANLEPCLIGIESCASSQYWARELTQQGHTVKLMNPKFIIPYRKSGKNDANDAEAICEAVGRPNMRFVAVKSVEQQAVCSLHRSRQHVTNARTALINHCRGLLAEFGVVLPQGSEKLRQELPALLADETSGIPPILHTLMQEHLADLARMDQRIHAIDLQLRVWMSQHEEAQRLEQIKGVGVVTATAFVAGVVDAHLFKNSRQFAAWLGLVPKQYSSGGKTRLGGITKQGDVYLRTLLVQGARGIVYQAGKREDKFSGWIKALVARAGVNKAVIAVAAKQARIIWAMLVHDAAFQPERIGVAA